MHQDRIILSARRVLVARGSSVRFGYQIQPETCRQSPDKARLPRERDCCGIDYYILDSIIYYGHDAQKGNPNICVPGVRRSGRSGRRLRYGKRFRLISRCRGTPQEELPVFRPGARQEVSVDYLQRPESNIFAWKSKMTRQHSRVLHDMAYPERSSLLRL